jgi:hypothetical protein
MIMTIIGILVLIWILGLVFNVAGGLIHILIVAAVVLFLWNLITGRRNV